MKANILISLIKMISAPQSSPEVVKLDVPQQKRYIEVFSLIRF